MYVSKTKHREGEPDNKKQGHLKALWNDIKQNAKTIRFWVEVLALFGLVAYTHEARRTNNLTQQSLANAKVALSIQERAWMGFGGVKPLHSPNAAGRFIYEGVTVNAHTELKNYGQTPARKVQNRGNMKIFCEKFSNDPPYDESAIEIGIKSSSTFMPGREDWTALAALDHPLTKDDISNLESKRCWLYFFAKSEYCDIFNIRHYRHLCAQWAPGTPFAFADCATYNDGDEDRPDQKPQEYPAE